MSTSGPLVLDEVDPFDLPEWLGEVDVVWSPERGLGTGHLVPGALTGPTREFEAVACDLLAVDEAYPLPVTEPELRRRAHQLWKHGQVLLTSREGRLTLAVPGTTFTADRTLECLRRLALSVGASTQHYSALLRITRSGGTHPG